jgi:hypothetical protein
MGAILYLALCWSGHDAGQHELIAHHIEANPRNCWAEIKIYKSNHVHDNRLCACIPFRQIDVSPTKGD